MQPYLKQVLVVDDDRDIRDTLEMVFAGEGYAVLKAPDGAVALDILRQSEAPLPVFLDLRMPRIDGVEVLRRVKAEMPLKGHAFTMLTANGGMISKELQQLMRQLQVELINKPFDITELLSGLEHMEQRLVG